MRRIKGITAGLIALIFLLLSLKITGAQGVPDESDAEFVRVAMAEFKELDAAGLSTAVVRQSVYDYFKRLRQILGDTKMDNRSANSIMQEVAAWYGQAVAAIFQGKNLQEAIQGYTYKITDVFFKHHLDIPVQSQIVALTSDNLEAMSPLFKNLKK